MDLLKFFEAVDRLKEVQRTGWVERGVKNPENSAEHSFLVALMVLIMGKKKKFSMEKMLKMALVHDLPEAMVGDIITKENWEACGQMWNSEKMRLERPAMKELSSLAGDKELLELWEEFESQNTPESRFVKECDRLATIFQAVEYRKAGNYRKPLPGFWDAKAVATIKDPGLKAFLKNLLSAVK